MCVSTMIGLILVYIALLYLNLALMMGPYVGSWNLILLRKGIWIKGGVKKI